MNTRQEHGHHPARPPAPAGETALRTRPNPEHGATPTTNRARSRTTAGHAPNLQPATTDREARDRHPTTPPTTNGPETAGPETDRATTDRATIDPHGADPHGADGHGTGGHRTGAHATNGHGTDRHGGERHATGHGHGHGVSAGADRRYLLIALGLIVGFMLVEVIVGLLSGSLVLLADAGHMVSDAAAIGLALFAMRLAARPARGAFTFGLKRAEILSALANGATLLGLSLFFVIEAITRLIDPPAVAGGPVLVIALVGVIVNIAATLVLRRANRQSLNVEGSFQHILTDLYAFIGTAVAGVIILVTGFVRADAIASLLVAALMIKAGIELVRESGRIILEAAPRGTDPDTVRRGMIAVPGVLDVHELHIWEVTSGFPALSAHILVDRHQDCHERRHDLERLLADRFGIRHTTLQVDHPCHLSEHRHPAVLPHDHRDDPGCPTAR